MEDPAASPTSSSPSSPPPEPTRPSLLAETRWLLGAELRSAGRALGAVTAAVGLAGVVMLLTAVVGRGIAPPARGTAALFMAVIFAGIQAASDSFGQAAREGSLLALMVGPTRPLAIYLAKGARVLLTTWVAGVTALALLLLLRASSDWAIQAPRVLLLVLAGGLGVSCLATLVGPLLGGEAGRESMFALVLLPVLVPLVALGARGVRALLASRPDLALFRESVGLVAGLDLLLLVCALWLFEPLVRARR